MSSDNTLMLRRNRREITQIDRERGWCWYNGKRYPVPNGSDFLEIAVLPEITITK